MHGYTFKCTNFYFPALFESLSLPERIQFRHFFYMKTHIIRRALLALGICSALNMQAQAPHPERIYLSGTGTDYTRTWEFYCSKTKFREMEIHRGSFLLGIARIWRIHLWTLLYYQRSKTQ